MTVHIASRLESLADPGSVLVSRACTDATSGARLAFVPRGTRSLKGIDGEWEVPAVAP